VPPEEEKSKEIRVLKIMRDALNAWQILVKKRAR
jgi:hypothetical protein